MSPLRLTLAERALHGRFRPNCPLSAGRYPLFG